MIPFSSRVVRVIESFANNMGIRALAAADNSYGFEFTRFGKLSIVPSEDSQRVIVCLTRVPHRADLSNQRRLFDLAGFDPRYKTTVHAGLAPNGAFVLAMDVDETSFDAWTLDETFSRLNALHDAIA